VLYIETHGQISLADKPYRSASLAIMINLTFHFRLPHITGNSISTLVTGLYFPSNISVGEGQTKAESEAVIVLRRSKTVKEVPQQHFLICLGLVRTTYLKIIQKVSKRLPVRAKRNDRARGRLFELVH